MRVLFLFLCLTDTRIYGTAGIVQHPMSRNLRAVSWFKQYWNARLMGVPQLIDKPGCIQTSKLVPIADTAHDDSHRLMGNWVKHDVVRAPKGKPSVNNALLARKYDVAASVANRVAHFLLLVIDAVNIHTYHKLPISHCILRWDITEILHNQCIAYIRHSICGESEVVSGKSINFISDAYPRADRQTNLLLSSVSRSLVSVINSNRIAGIDAEDYETNNLQYALGVIKAITLCLFGFATLGLGYWGLRFCQCGRDLLYGDVGPCIRLPVSVWGVGVCVDRFCH